jgi:hypothetical protein
MMSRVLKNQASDLIRVFLFIYSIVTTMHGSTFLVFLARSATILTVLFGLVEAAEPTKDELAFFEGKVRPLLAKHCYECHSAQSDKVKGGLLLDTKEGWMEGGDSGEALVPGKPSESLLLESVRYKNPDLQMPPKYQLTEAETAILEDWIEMGAPDPRSGGPVKKSTGIDWEKGKAHWAFQPISRPTPPTVSDTGWVRKDLDHFILSKIESAGIQPARDADRFALIRRVSLDLTGLPPTVAEVSSFIHDPGSDDEALAKVVDKLLQSPAFGERWGRYWLDVARYADSVGKTRNIPFPYAWRYRNYVIDAFNRDKPYNEFLHEQIAGDLLPTKGEKDRDENFVATGFLALGSVDLNERDNVQFQLDRIDDQMDTLSRATMGVTLACARCHDHKFDPISQTDYYAMAGIFNSTRTMSGVLNRQGGSKQYFQPSLLVRLDESKNAKTAAPKKGSEELERIRKLRARLEEIQSQAKIGNLSRSERQTLKATYDRLRKQLAELDANSVAASAKKKSSRDEPTSIEPDAPLVMAAIEGEVEDLALRVRGEPDIKGDLVPRGFPVVFKQVPAPKLDDEGSGRKELAFWLTSREHPLTSRVMVNRIWGHLFGRGLVETVDNFGLSGAAPTHPELLDHLAQRFMADNWSIKSMIREIVLSRTYRLSSENLAANSKVDEGNKLYWHSNLRRLEAEAIRDSLLAAGGLLQEKRPEGAPFDASFAGDISKSKKLSRRDANDAIDQPVRSIYLPVFRSRLPGMFTVFDFAEPSQVNGQRDVTTVAPQALFLLNNPFVVDVSKRAADRILEQKMSDETVRVKYAYAYTLCRYPTEEETKQSLAFLESGSDRRSSWAELTQALYSSAEFRYIP